MTIVGGKTRLIPEVKVLGFMVVSLKLFFLKFISRFWFIYIVQLGPRSKQSLSLKVWTKDEH